MVYYWPHYEWVSAFYLSNWDCGLFKSRFVNELHVHKPSPSNCRLLLKTILSKLIINYKVSLLFINLTFFPSSSFLNFQVPYRANKRMFHTIIDLLISFRQDLSLLCFRISSVLRPLSPLILAFFSYFHSANRALTDKKTPIRKKNLNWTLFETWF